MIEVIERPKVEIVAVLRRGELDAKDAAIVRAVVRGWNEGLRVTFREIEASTGYAISNIFFRVRGYDHDGARRRGGGLIERGWLRSEPFINRVLIPGPRFAGMDGDHPLEKVETA